MLLVTGANGFVGRHLVATLAARGLALRRALRTAVADGSQSGDVVVGEFGPGTDWSAALAGVDGVVHLAGLAHVDPRRVPDALATYRRVNVDATLALAEAAQRAGVARFVFVSSVKVNGESSGARPFAVDDAPAPSDPYGTSKLEAETALRARTGAMSLSIVRPPLVYGPGVRANFLKLIDLVAKGVPLPLASVTNRRSLVSVDNLCDLLARLATDVAAPAGTYFASDGEDLSTPELIRRIARALQVSPRLVPFPPRLLTAAAAVFGQGEAAQRLLGSLQVDITAARERLGWKPPFSMNDTLARTARWYRDRQSPRE
jgi:nucleoside-diphosphate-sugar epimerase